MLFAIQLIPFVVLLGYLSLEGRNILSVDGPAGDHAPTALRRIIQIHGLPFEDLYEEQTAGPESPTDTEGESQETPNGDSDAGSDDDDRNQTADGGEVRGGDDETGAGGREGNVPTPVELNDRAVDEITGNKSAQREVVQVAVTAADQVHLPAQFVGLAIAGGALLVGEVLQTPADSPMMLAGMTLSATRQEVAGLILICYIGFMLLAVPLTMAAFREVDPSRYYLARMKRQRDISDSDEQEGDDTFIRRYRENASDRLMPRVHVVTLVLIIVVHFI
ncbi:hypothetical protein [Halopelagius longus]|uniref:hypothetical protein n=1 Tax=Halopelagius longus TaxID=1236180 RepID=UPI0011144802|nr:hypothetical protein [Halopelagius longus]